ncbi:hypothetical protein PLESTM_000865000 [Pleodorina starrii]|nr:hypothetical protein PLESTM_000865000 [Pleodorina starrii]
MAYSFCWRYACLPPVFATTRFTATCRDLERWNIAKMGGNFSLDFQGPEGVDMYFYGKPKNAPLGSNITYTKELDSTVIQIPDGGFGNFTFVYTVPPGNDDLSAAVVMDAVGPRPPPPPRSISTTCACPRYPEETIGGTPGRCNSTYATMVARFANETEKPDNFTDVFLCVPWPNYDLLMREMAWSHCWLWSCLPKEMEGKAYTLTINQVARHNIPLMPPARYELILFPAPFGMEISMTLFPVEGAPMHFNSTVGMPVVGGTMQNVTMPPLSNLTIQYNIPATWNVDGLAAATILRMVRGTELPGPPLPPAMPPSPPSPPPGAAAVPRVLITTDFMITANISLASLTGGAAEVGKYVTVPIKFYDYSVLPDCSESSTQAYAAKLRLALGLSPSDTVLISCRFAAATYGDALRRRLRRMLIGSTSWLLQRAGMATPRSLQDASSSTEMMNVQATYTVKTGIDPTTSAAGFCSKADGLGNSKCEPSSVETAAWVQYTADKIAAQVTGDPCSALAQEAKAEILRQAQISPYSVQNVTCTSVALKAADTGISPSPEPQGSNIPNSGTGTGNNTTTNPQTPAASPSSSKSGLSAGAIAGIVIGSVGGVVIVAVVGLTIKNRIDQGPSTYVDPSSARPGARRWRTYSMQQRAEEATSGRRPIAGVSVYT